MKGKYITIVLVSFFAGAFLSGLYVYSKFRVNKYTQWGTYVSTNLKFSIEYPQNLVSKETHYEEGHNDGSIVVAGGLVEWAPFSRVVPFVSVIVGRLPEPKEWSQLQPTKKYWTSPTENRAGARIYHGEKMYSINIENLNPQDAERMINSIKFLE